MRIALDATYSTGRELTGVGVYSREILHGLAARYPDDTFSLCYRPHKFFKSFADPFPAGARRRPLFDKSLPAHDVFHGLNQRLPMAKAKRAVTTFHDLFVISGDYSTPEFRERFTAQARDAAERSDLIICVSAFTASQVTEHLGVPASRLRVVHHGVRGPAAQPEKRGREPIVLSVGSIQKRKNTARLVEAFSRTKPGWKLILAGAAGYGAEEILEKIQNSPRREDIEVTGYISRAALERLYERASLFAFPSLDEGFGIPVIEAMAWGVPVITTEKSALAEVSGDAALHVDPASTAEIETALQTLMDQAGLRRELARRGLEWSAKFSWDRAVSATRAVYAELD